MMCLTRSSRYVELNGRRFRVDGCMADTINLLNEKGKKEGYETVGCCCGHGRYRETVLIRTKKGEVYEIYSGITTPRKRRFYKTDKDGYYYIPEVSEAKT